MSASTTIRRHKPAADGAPQAAILELADRLTGHGFDIGDLDGDQSGHLAMTNVRGALCTLNLRDDGHMTWEYRPCHGTHTDPAYLVDIVMRLLGAEDGDPVAGRPNRGLTLKGAVGRMLTERGMTVRLAIVQQDDVNYDLYAEIEVTNPAEPARGRVRVTDHATIRWECSCRTSASHWMAPWGHCRLHRGCPGRSAHLSRHSHQGSRAVRGPHTSL